MTTSGIEPATFRLVAQPFFIFKVTQYYFCIQVFVDTSPFLSQTYRSQRPVSAVVINPITP